MLPACGPPGDDAQIGDRALAVASASAAAASGAAAPCPPAKLLYLDFDGETVTGRPGCSSTLENCSSVVARMGTATLTPYRGDVARVVADVRRRYAEYNVSVVTQRPQSGTYEMTIVGGSPEMVGQPKGKMGVAPADCGDANPNDISFVFTDVVGDDPFTVAAAIAHESGHTRGLDHVVDNLDTMFPAPRPQSDFTDRVASLDFVESPANCTGTWMQASRRVLLANVGPACTRAGTPPAPRADGASASGADSAPRISNCSALPGSSPPPHGGYAAATLALGLLAWQVRLRGRSSSR
jgi:hypothetical protein